MRILSVDYGRKRIGLAITDPGHIIAQPLEVVTQPGVNRIKDIVKEFNVGKIVVGLPLNMDGTPGKDTPDVRNFVLKLTENLKDAHCEIELFDERLTTRQAERALIEANVSRKKRKEKIDRISACVLLESYLDYIKTKAK